MKFFDTESIKKGFNRDFGFSKAKREPSDETLIRKPSLQLRFLRILCRLFIQPYIVLAFISPFFEQSVANRILAVLDFFHVAARKIPAQRSKQIIEGICVYWFTPEKIVDDSKIIVYVHGGGFFFGSAYTHGMFARKLAFKTGLKVCFLDYKLGPEVQCPETVEQIARVYNYIISEGTPSKNVMFGGDSSGANQILALLQKLVSNGTDVPKAVFLESPFIDVSLSSPSVLENWKRDCIVPFPPFAISYAVNKFRKLYGGGKAVTDPEVSPINGSCRGLPPMLISYGNDESLRDDSIRLIAKSRDEGVSVEDYAFNMTPHGNLLFCGFYPEANESLRNVTRFIYSNFKL